MLEFTDATLVIVKVMALLFITILGSIWFGWLVKYLLEGRVHQPLVVVGLRVARFVVFLACFSFILYCMAGIVVDLVTDIPHMWRYLSDVWQGGKQAVVIVGLAVFALLIWISILLSKKLDPYIDRAFRFITPKQNS